MELKFKCKFVCVSHIYSAHIHSPKEFDANILLLFWPYHIHMVKCGTFRFLIKVLLFLGTSSSRLGASTTVTCPPLTTEQKKSKQVNKWSMCSANSPRVGIWGRQAGCSPRLKRLNFSFWKNWSSRKLGNSAIIYIPYPRKALNKRDSYLKFFYFSSKIIKVLPVIFWLSLN